MHYGCSASRKVREQLLTAGANPNAPDQIGQTPLHLAATNERYLETIQQLLAAGADPNARTVSGRTPLHVATERPVVERLVTWGADPNAQDKHGRTPLHDAVSNPDTSNQTRFERVTLLLNAGADPNARTESGETPLHLAASHLRDSHANIRQLLDAQADPRAKDELGNTPLHYAAGKATPDRVYAVEELIERGASGREQNQAGNTPLHYAARRDGEGQARAVTKMLDNGADLDIRNAEGKTPRDVAVDAAKELFVRRYHLPEQEERRAMNSQAAYQAPDKPNRVEEYHKQFADQIVEQIRQGNAPWQKPWKPGEESLPKNLSSGREYRGGNSMYLSVSQTAKGYSDNRWGTYKQIQAMGGHVRKGERGTRILSFQDHKQIAVTDKAGKPVTDGEGKRVYRYEKLEHPMVRQYTVFNADQADGLKLPERPSQQPEWKAHTNAEAVMRASGVKINHVAGDRAFYNLDNDQITLPERGQFPSASHYYQTALHELGHATGHESRLNRPSLQEGVKAGFGSEAYAKEELRAEMSAMMTGQRVGVGHDPSRGAAYVEGWLKALKDDPRVPQTPLPAPVATLLAGESRGEDMSDGLELLKPFLPGLENVLDDPEVSEIMINGPHNVWIEGHGKLYPHEAPLLTAAALHRAAIHIARPLGLDPATAPIVDARLEDGSRVAICVPPASPEVAITVRRFGKRAFSADDLVEQGALPESVRQAAERMLLTRRNILVSGGTGSGKTTLLNALIELLPDDERIVSIEDTLELRIEHSNCVRFEARGLATGAVTIRDLVRHALRHRPDHIVVGEVRGGEAADLLQALNTGHGGSLTTVHANNAESALSRLASCAMQGGGELPWEVTCRGVVDGIAMVIHMTRSDGRRFVEEAAFVKGYEAAGNRWLTEPICKEHHEGGRKNHTGEDLHGLRPETRTGC